MRSHILHQLYCFLYQKRKNELKKTENQMLTKITSLYQSNNKTINTIDFQSDHRIIKPSTIKEIKIHKLH